VRNGAAQAEERSRRRIVTCGSAVGSARHCRVSRSALASCFGRRERWEGRGRCCALNDATARVEAPGEVIAVYDVSGWTLARDVVSRTPFALSFRECLGHRQ